MEGNGEKEVERFATGQRSAFGTSVVSSRALKDERSD
jgi:hypothetical protein